jgi:hypothetical protein
MNANNPYAVYENEEYLTNAEMYWFYAEEAEKYVSYVVENYEILFQNTAIVEKFIDNIIKK